VLLENVYMSTVFKYVVISLHVSLTFWVILNKTCKSMRLEDTDSEVLLRFQHNVMSEVGERLFSLMPSFVR